MPEPSRPDPADVLSGLPGGGRNIAYEALDRHVTGPRAAQVALRFRSASGDVDLTYRELFRRAARVTAALRHLGLGKGDRIVVLCDRTPELYATVLGGLRAGIVVSPLFSSYGPEPVAERLRLSGARVVVASDRLYRRSVQPIRHQVPTLEHVVVAGAGADADVLDLERLTADATASDEIERTTGEDPALIHFTSGTTGRPKGAVHVHDAVVTHHRSARDALDLRSDDIYWCTADPGWVTGTSYGIIAPLVHGATSVVDDGDFDPVRWLDILEQEKVSVLYTAPTALRLLRRSGVVTDDRDLSALRIVASVGEPLGADATLWGADAFGVPVHDTWWQTETGAIMIAAPLGEVVVPGSMGRPLPGVEAAVVHRGDDGAVVEETSPGIRGELALRPGWNSMFRGYLSEEARYRRCFSGGWYLTGDLVRRDRDGRFWFAGRSDDVIESAGHLIGPSEVEAVLLMDPSVAEAAVVGRPDPVIGESVTAFVVLMPDVVDEPEEIRRGLLARARRHLGAAVAPRQIEFVDDLPHTQSGKTMRRLLRDRLREDARHEVGSA